MTNITEEDESWMRHALNLAKQAELSGEVPVGAVLVRDGKIIGKGHNCPISKNDPSAHAEIVALQDAAKRIGNYRIENASLYVTLEPCPMCVGALLQARIKKLIFAARDTKSGAVGGVINLLADNLWTHKIDYSSGILSAECGEILREFFRARRNK